jgi:tripartite-type tricarboxylate transporter receptor subunit TctC
MRLLRTIGGLLLCAAFATPVTAVDDYPTRPIKIIVPWRSGGVADFLARLAAVLL